MDIQALVAEQVTDIFRIGMILFLAITSMNTAHATATRAGRAVPLVLGVIFIAVLIPVTFNREAADLVPRIAVGIVVNAILLAVVMGGIRVVRQLTGR